MPETHDDDNLVIPRDTVPSGNIRSIGHANGVMDIEFHNGNIYRYRGPKVSDHFAGIMKAPSKGKFFTEHIRHCKDTTCKHLNPKVPGAK